MVPYMERAVHIVIRPYCPLTNFVTVHYYFPFIVVDGLLKSIISVAAHCLFMLLH